jgi:hypothetical protein
VRGQRAQVYDEGNIVNAGWRVAEGQVLYRDLWTMHAPGTPHLISEILGGEGYRAPGPWSPARPR